MVRKPYPPGQKRKRRFSPPSEYAKELREKQKLKSWYNLGEKQFRNYVRSVLERKGEREDVANLLIERLESRLDNVVFNSGFAKSRAQARELISHSFFLVNGKPVNIPSYSVKKGDTISIRPQKLKKVIFKDLKNSLKKHKTPNWLQLDIEKLEGKVVNLPTLEEASPPVEISSIFEYYSR
jgi:small subunit ribosomal protein S4